MYKNVARYGLLICLSLIFAYVERFFVIPAPVPGIKLGLANIVTLIAFYTVGMAGAFLISVLRVILSALLFSGLGSLMFSMGGCLLSFVAMALAKKSGLFSLTGIGVCGGICHNVGQIAVAALVVENVGLLTYLPVLVLSGAVCGFLTGKVAGFVLPHLPQTKAHAFDDGKEE